MANSKNPSLQRSKTSLLLSSRLLASIILGAFFFNTGVLPVRLVILTNADELPADFEFKAPQTVNVPTEETEDFNGYDNELRQEIPEDKSTLNERGTSELQPGVPTIIDTTIPVAISNLMKEYQQRILASNFLNQASNFLKALYTTNPNTSGAMALLFNNENYLRLRKEAEDKKRKALENNLKNKNKRLVSLKDFYLKTLKKIKNQLQESLSQWQARKNTISNKLNQVKASLNNIQQKLNNIPSLKTRLQSALANFNNLRGKEDEHRRAYDSERKEYKHDRKKYKKYKKKYKKKHKSKYKHRYKKYKKKYKKHKRRAETQQKRYRDYEKQKNQAWQEYQAILAELNREKDYQKQLNTLNQEQEIIQTNLASLKNNEPTDGTATAVNRAKEDYARGIVNTKKLYQQKEEEAETIFQTDLERAEVYREEIASFFANSPLFFLTKDEQDEILKDMQEKIVDGRAQAQERIETRYQVTRQTAQTVFLGLLSTPSKLLQAIKGKISTASKYLSKIRKKADKLEEIYKETKAYKKKVKKYKKKYEKYAKKAKKAHGKKRRKYENKKSSAKKKYEKYLKKYNKYYGLKKAYKSGAKQAEQITDAYQDQYNYLLNLQNQLQTNYNDSLNYASKVKNQILTRGENEKKESLEQLKLISPWDYNLIASGGNEDLKQYLSLVLGASKAGPLEHAEQAKGPAFSEQAEEERILKMINSLDFQSGLNSLKSLDKNFKKLRHKAKKAYKKAIKKEQERMARINRENEARRRAYYAKLARQQREAEAERQSRAYQTKRSEVLSSAFGAGVHYDQWGNGYSSAYNTYYSDRVIKPSWLTYNSNSYDQSTKSKFSWRNIFGATALASTIKSSYKPEKSWWNKVKDWGKRVFGKVKSFGGKTKQWYTGFKETVLDDKNSWYNRTNKVLQYVPPVFEGKLVVKGGEAFIKHWYNDYKKQDVFGKVTRALDLGGDTLGIISGGLWAATVPTFGAAALPALALDGIGGVMDAVSGTMYAMRGDKLNAGIKFASILPVVGSVTALGRRGLQGGKVGLKIMEETKEAAKLREAYAPFAKVTNEIIGKGKIDSVLSKIPKGFEIVDDAKGLKRLGFVKGDVLFNELKEAKSIIFHNAQTGEKIIASAGTKSLRDWVVNIINYPGFDTSQHAAAREVARLLNRSEGVLKNLVAVGHSKGGGLAQIIGGMTKVKTYTFNTAALRKIAFKRGKIQIDSLDNITSSINKWDILNSTQIRSDSILSLISPKPVGRIVMFGEKMPGAVTFQAKLGQWIRGIFAHSNY